MKRLLTAGLIAGPITFALCNSTVARNLPVDNSNASLLEGTWEGKATHVDEYYKKPFYTDIRLTIARGSPMHGEFKNGRGNRWGTKVVLRYGKVLLVGWHGRRKFTLDRNSDNTLSLKAHFEEGYGGRDYDVIINLKKTATP